MVEHKIDNLAVIGSNPITFALGANESTYSEWQKIEQLRSNYPIVINSDFRLTEILLTNSLTRLF